MIRIILAVSLWVPLVFIIYEMSRSVFVPNVDGIKVEKNVSSITNKELHDVTETLFNMDMWDMDKYISVNYQGQILSRNYTDIAPEPLMYVSSAVFTNPTVVNFMKLFDNYEPSTLSAESKTVEEDNEEDKFIDDIVNTNMTLYIIRFLSSKGFLEADLEAYKKLLKTIWFQQYARDAKGAINSCGFEHVFLAETKLGKSVIGFHNWIYFSVKESSKEVNYLGFGNKRDLTAKSSIAELHFTYKKRRKFSTMFIGTSPQLEISLYTLCFFARPNKKCHISLAGLKFGIQTYKLRNTDFLGTAYPIM